MRGLGLRFLGANFSTTLGRQVVAAFIALATTAMIARVYGPESNGAYAILLFVPSTLTTILSLGIGAANVYLIGSGKCRPEEALSANLYLGTVLSLLGAACGALFLLLKGRQAFPGVDYPLLWLALPIFPLTLLAGFLTSILQAKQDFRNFNRLLLLQPALFLVAVALGSAIGMRSLIFLVAAQLASQLACFGVTLAAMRHVSSKVQAEEAGRPAVNIVRSAVAYGWKAHLSGILAFVNYKADIFLLNLFIDPSAAGVYVIAVSLAEKLWIISMAVSTVLLPRLSELEGAENIRRQLTPILTRIVLLVTLISALALAVCAYPLVLIFFGTQYLHSLGSLYVLLPGMVILSAARVLANDLASRNRPDLNMYIAALSVIVNITANIVLIPTLGLLGASLATTLAYTLWAGCTLAVYCRISTNRFVDTVLINSNDVALAMTAIRQFARSSS